MLAHRRRTAAARPVPPPGGAPNEHEDFRATAARSGECARKDALAHLPTQAENHRRHAHTTKPFFFCFGHRSARCLHSYPPTGLIACR
jgi:hypothetical protein